MKRVKWFEVLACEEMVGKPVKKNGKIVGKIVDVAPGEVTAEITEKIYKEIYCPILNSFIGVRMIQVTGAKVNLTEQTVHELLSAIEKAKEMTTFTDDPMPEGDMDTETHIKLMRERGEIVVKSLYSDIEYHISIEKRPQSQESLGYRLIPGKGAVKIGKDGRCLCSCADKCPLGKAGMQDRCTKEELQAAGIQVIE